MTPWNVHAGPADYLAAVRAQLELDAAHGIYCAAWERAMLPDRRAQAQARAQPAKLPGFCRCGQRLPHGPWSWPVCPRCRAQAQP